MIGDYEDDPKGYKEMLGYILHRVKARTHFTTKTYMCDMDSLIASEIDCKTCCFAYAQGCIISEGMYRLVK